MGVQIMLVCFTQKNALLVYSQGVKVWQEEI